MAEVRFATYNTLNLFESDSADERERYGRVVEVIRGLLTPSSAVPGRPGTPGSTGRSAGASC